MINSKFVIATLKTTLSILLIGGIGLWSSSLSAKISTSKNTAQHLEGFVARQLDRFDGVGERVIDSTLEPTIELPSERATEKTFSSYSDLTYKVTDDSSSNWEVKAASQDWENLNHGEGVKDIVRFVVWRF